MTTTFEKDFRIAIRGIVSRPELNGRSARVTKTGPDRCQVKVEDSGEAVSIKHSNLVLLSDQIDAALRHLSPYSLSQFVDDVIAGTCTTSDAHSHAEDLSYWASDASVAAVLAGPQCEALAKAMTDSALFIGKACVDNFRGRGPIRVLGCSGCNTAYEGSQCIHEEAPPRVRAPAGGGWDELARLAHSAMLRMGLVTSLLRACSMPGEERLLDLLVVEAPAGVKTHEWLQGQMVAGRVFAPQALIGVVDNCQAVLPKCAHLAVSLLSLMVSRRPAALMATMDAEPWVASMQRYLGDVFDRIKVVPCLVEEVYGVGQLLNAIPLLYHLGDWARASVVLARQGLPASIATLSINMLHEVHAGRSQDKPLDLMLARLPEVAGARCAVGRLYGDAGEALLRQRPQTFAIAALIEVQGRWQHRGVDVSRATCPSNPPDELAATMSARERASYVEEISTMWREYLPRLDEVIESTPEIGFTRPIAAALASGMRPSLPSPARSLLRGPLHSHMTCAQCGCTRSTATGGGELMICSGGCGGLARYCCAEHQRAHWAQHKHFCRAQQKVTDDPEYAELLARFGDVLSAELGRRMGDQMVARIEARGGSRG